VPAKLRPPFSAVVLKEDACSRVERVWCGGRSLIRKTYRARPFLLWRTFGLRPKAAREYANLARLVSAAVPAVRPVAWEATRVLGCVPTSSLLMEDAGEVSNLKAKLAGMPPTDRRRAALLVAYGRLLGQLHSAGFLSLTAYPRNVLVLAEQPPELRLCDQPSLQRWRSRVLGSARAALDVYDVVFTGGRARAWSRAERLRVLVAYTGDRGEAARLWRRYSRRPLWVHRALKGALKLAYGLRHPRQPAASAETPG
jgi:hypothetical protein